MSSAWLRNYDFSLKDAPQVYELYTRICNQNLSIQIRVGGDVKVKRYVRFMFLPLLLKDVRRYAPHFCITLFPSKFCLSWLMLMCLGFFKSKTYLGANKWKYVDLFIFRDQKLEFWIKNRVFSCFWAELCIFRKLDFLDKKPNFRPFFQFFGRIIDFNIGFLE